MNAMKTESTMKLWVTTIRAERDRLRREAEVAEEAFQAAYAAREAAEDGDAFLIAQIACLRACARTRALQAALSAEDSALQELYAWSDPENQ